MQGAILSEIEALKHKLKDKLKTTQVQYAQDLHTLQQEISKVKEERDVVRKELDVARIKCNQITQESARMSLQVTKLKQMCSNKTDRISNQVGIIDKYKQEIKRLQNQNQIASNESEALRRNNKRLLGNSSHVCLKMHVESTIKSDQAVQTLAGSRKDKKSQTDASGSAVCSVKVQTDVFGSIILRGREEQMKCSVTVQTEDIQHISLLEKERDALEQELLDTYAYLNSVSR